MGWLGIDPKSIRDILITHQDTDHVGAVEADSPGLFRQARLYVGEIENRYLTGEVRRKVIYHLYKLPQVTINNEKVLLKDEQVFHIGEIEIRCFHVPGHTWGHMVYLIDGQISVHRRHDLVWRGRRIQLHFRAGGGQQAGGLLPGGTGSAPEKARRETAVYHRTHGLDG